MKRLFYFAVLLLGFAACSDSKEQSNQIEPNSSNDKTEIEGVLSSFGDYEEDMATQLLCKKYWIEHYFLEYGENWDKILFNSLIDLGGGHTSSCFIFHEDGKLEDFTDAEHTPEEEYEVRTWTFDPETRILTIDDTENYHLIALGEETFVWDLVSTSSGYPRYFREVFKVKAVK